ncbi:hypothetical protein H4696_006801 [Amycolatopsis lexingtonensis]|uniref:Uncharacterized protein n=1 Tax=Amycolatopsis lexingtonensis TaxID=218822 RepID=A0ABR9I934_9PSEU|nr:hypothetical protein [Amycolatopsis lexingtonensis]
MWRLATLRKWLCGVRWLAACREGVSAVWRLATLWNWLRGVRWPAASRKPLPCLPTGVNPLSALRRLTSAWRLAAGWKLSALRSASPLATLQPRWRPTQRRLPTLHHPARIRHPRLLSTARRHRTLTTARHTRRRGRREPARRLRRPTALNRRRPGIRREGLVLAARETRCPDVVLRTSGVLASELRARSWGRRHAVAALGFRCRSMRFGLVRDRCRVRGAFRALPHFRLRRGICPRRGFRRRLPPRLLGPRLGRGRWLLLAHLRFGTPRFRRGLLPTLRFLGPRLGCRLTPRLRRRLTPSFGLLASRFGRRFTLGLGLLAP